MTGSIDRLAVLPPGPELAVALAVVDATALSAHQLVLVAVARQRQQAYDEAALLRVFAELASRPEYQRCGAPDELSRGHVHRAVSAAGDEVSLALAWTPGRAAARVALAVELIEDLPDTFAALEAGRIDADKARLIAERTRCLPDPASRRGVEQIVLPVAQTRTRWVLDQRLRREVIAADPAGAEARRRAAAQRRHVGRPEPAAPGGEDGMATLTLCGPAEDVTALWVATDTAARHARTGGDSRTLDQLRFDLLTGLAWTALDSGHLGCCNPACTTAPAAPPPRGPLTGSSSASDERTSRHRHASPPSAAGSPHLAQPSDAGRPSDAVRSADIGQPSRTGQPSNAAGPSEAAGYLHLAEPSDTVRSGDTGRHGDTGGPSGTGRPSGTGQSSEAGGRRQLAAGPVVLGRRRGKAATVHATVPFDALVGASEAPGALDGYGPITAVAARSIGGEATLRRLLTDPVDGRLLEYGRTTYSPPADLAAHVVARDRTCRFPTCHRPATEAEIDHKIPYARGGSTDPGNTWALHDGHHRAKTWHGYRIITDPAGDTWWITPAGHRHRVEPEIVGPTLSTSAPAAVTLQRNDAQEAVPF